MFYLQIKFAANRIFLSSNELSAGTNYIYIEIYAIFTIEISIHAKKFASGKLAYNIVFIYKYIRVRNNQSSRFALPVVQSVGYA